MANVDQFESVFKSAAKAVYHYKQPPMRTVAVVTDLPHDDAVMLTERVSEFLRVLGDEPAWRPIAGNDTRTVTQLLGLAEKLKPDLVCTYRNLHSTTGNWPHTLGRHLDVMAQQVDCPVLVLPHPGDTELFEHALGDTNAVMAVTDHLAGDNRLVDYAVRMTQANGELFLSHVEDDATFQRYVDVIGKIPEIDTDVAERRIMEHLLKEPADYIRSCAAELDRLKIPVRVEPVVTMGHQLKTYQALIDEHHIDLLVINTRDEDQMAMHGLAYPLAVELHSTPLLML